MRKLKFENIKCVNTLLFPANFIFQMIDWQKGFLYSGTQPVDCQSLWKRLFPAIKIDRNFNRLDLKYIPVLALLRNMTKQKCVFIFRWSRSTVSLSRIRITLPRNQLWTKLDNALTKKKKKTKGVFHHEMPKRLKKNLYTPQYITY